MSAPTEEAILLAIRELARLHLDVDAPIGSDTRLVEDLDLDSLRRLTLAIEVEDRFRVCLEADDEAAIETVGDLVRTVRRKIAAG